MTDFAISIDLSSILAAGPGLRDEVFADLAIAVSRVVAAGEERWKTAVLSAPGLWDGERRAYEASITGEMIGPFAGVIKSDYRYVQDIETGRPPYDLKKMLDTSLKVRVSKAGNRYLIIPFRHNTPGNTAIAGAMPRKVYTEAKELKASQITGHGTRVSGTGAFDIKTKAPATVRARKYLWGGRVGAGAAPKLHPEHKTDPYAGMVRFKESTGGSTYLTFRVMSEKSTGWIIGARPGLFLAQHVAESLQRMADTDFPAAAAAAGSQAA